MEFSFFSIWFRENSATYQLSQCNDFVIKLLNFELFNRFAEMQVLKQIPDLYNLLNFKNSSKSWFWKLFFNFYVTSHSENICFQMRQVY